MGGGSKLWKKTLLKSVGLTLLLKEISIKSEEKQNSCMTSALENGSKSLLLRRKYFIANQTSKGMTTKMKALNEYIK